MNRILTFLISLLVAFSSLGTNVLANNTISKSSKTQYEEKFRQQLIAELKFLFTEASTYEHGVLKINHQLLIDKFGEEQAYYISEGIKKIYSKETAPRRRRRVRRNFVSCMIEEITDMIPYVDLYKLLTRGDVQEYIESRMWEKVSDIIIEYIKKKGMKNVFGLSFNSFFLSFQLGWSVGKCLGR